MIFYLDASVLVSAITNETRSTIARAWVGRNCETCFISGFAATEVAAAISRGLRNERFNQEQARAALDDFDLLRAMCRHHAMKAEALDLAETLVRDFNTKLAAPDALHLACAIEAGATLVTFDERLADAARLYSADVLIPV